MSQTIEKTHPIIKSTFPFVYLKNQQKSMRFDFSAMRDPSSVFCCFEIKTILVDFTRKII